MSDSPPQNIINEISIDEQAQGKIEKNNLDRVEESEVSSELWEKIGFHRPLGGYWYSLVFMLLTMVGGALFSGILLNLFYPYPTSIGYRTTTEELFKFFFVTFDLGTANIMGRYIGENSIKNPKNMIKYVQYFIWYQMITGLIQTTSVSIYALYIAPKSNLAHVVWLMLIIGTTQYPGFLGVFKNTLGALQQFNKTAILSFLGSDIIQRITEIVFVLLGRLYGMNHPEVGELMGIAIGSVIGLYVDDFISMVVSAIFFRNVMKKYHIEVSECFEHKLSWSFIKDPLLFGIKAGTPALIGVGMKLIILNIFLSYIPQYTTLVSLASIGGGIAGVIDQKLDMTPGISESFMNDKLELAKYYIGQSWRFAGLIQMFLLPILLMLIPILSDVFLAFKMDNYMLAIPFFPWMIIRKIQQPYTSLADQVVTGSNHPNWLMTIRFIEEIGKLLGAVLLVVWLAIPEKFGISSLVWILSLYEMPAIIFKTVASWIFTEKKIVQIFKEIPWWQTFGATSISAAAVYGTDYIFYLLIFNPLNDAFGIFIALIPMIIWIILSTIIVYMPLTVLLGGWDDASVINFKLAADMSGPSKFFVVPMANMVEKLSMKSKLHNKFKQNDDKALIEAKLLMEIKVQRTHKMIKENQEKMLEKNSN